MSINNLCAYMLTACCFFLLASCQREESNPRNITLSAEDGQEQKAVSEENTLSIIKPNSVAANHIGAIIERFEKGGLHIAGMKMLHLSQDQAERFYAIHKGRPFFKELVSFMISGPVVVMVLQGPKAIEKNREIMGATDPSKAAPGTIRADFAKSMTENAVHGSDAPETAKTEIAFFFGPNEIFDR